MPNLSLTTDGPVRRTSLSACQPTGWGDPTTFFPGYPDHFQIFLDRDSNYVVIWYLILSHHLSRASRDPARTTPQAAPLCNLCVRRLRRLGRGVGACPELLGALESSSLRLALNLQSEVRRISRPEIPTRSGLSTFNRVSFPSPSSPHLCALCALCVLCGENSLSFRSSLIPRHSPLTTKSFTIRTSETPLPQLLYNPHLQAPLGSAGNKGLITPLESALTKRWGVGAHSCHSGIRHTPLVTTHYVQVLSFQKIPHSFALVKNSTHFFSCSSTLFAKNTRVWGRDVDLPNHKRVLFRSLPESASFDSRPRPNIQSRRFVGRKPVELYQREQSYEKEFLGVCSRNFRFVWASSARSRASAGTRSEGAGSEACGKM